MHADITALLVRLCFTGPVLFVGLLLAVDPASFVQFSDNFASALQEFKYRLTGVPSGHSAASSASRGTLLSMRCIGVLLCAAAMLAIVVP